MLETHVHNDYVTGGSSWRGGWARSTSSRPATTSLSSGARSATATSSTAGGLRLRALHTPGHTFTHLAYVLEDATGRVPAVFTGGSLLFGRPGGPTCSARDHTEDLARAQYASAQPARRRAPRRRTPVFPTHGFGSFCSATPAAARVVDHRRGDAANPALTRDEDTFVADLLAGLDAYPAYYAHMGPLNAAGPAARRPHPAARVDAAEMRAADPGRRVGRRPAPPGRVRRRSLSRARSTSGSTATSPPTWAG